MKLNFTADPNYLSTPQFDLLPTGDYEVKIIEIENKQTKVGGALVLTLAVCAGPFAKRCVWVTLNLVHPDAEVVLRAHGELQMLCKIFGVNGQLDTDDLCGKPMLARIYTTKPKGNFPPKNSARNFRYANGLCPVAAQPSGEPNDGVGWVGAITDD